MKKCLYGVHQICSPAPFRLETQYGDQTHCGIAATRLGDNGG